jgi:hypothetical protein
VFSFRLIAVPAVVLGLAAGPALAQVHYPVDDCEVLDFDVLQSGVGVSTDTQAVPPPFVGHLISNTRVVRSTVYAGGGTARARLHPTAADDVIRIDVPSQGEVRLSYPLSVGGIDLTASGSVDRIEMYVAGPGPVSVDCLLYDTVSGHVDGETVTAGFTVIEWLLTSFTSIDPSDVTKIEFSFSAPGTYYVRDVRLRGTASEDLLFVPDVETAIVPPLPTPPLEIRALAAGTGDPLYDLNIGITQADAGFTPALQLGWSTVDAFDGEAGILLLDWTDFAPFDPLQLSFSIDVAAGAGGLFPELYPPDPFHGPEGMTLVFPTQLRTFPGGPVIGTSETWLTIGQGPDQANEAMTFENVSVQPNAGPLRSWSPGFTVSFLLQPGAPGVETIWPILEMTWWSEWSPTTATDVPTPSTASLRPALVAAPGITRTGTEIRSAHPFERAAELRVHDVTGRSLATLRPAPGAGSVFWDGRDDRGEALPTGVYFIRRMGGPEPAARVVKLR